MSAASFAGDNLAAVSHGNLGLGYGVEALVAEYKKVGLLFSYNHSAHQVTDRQLLGNFKKSVYNHLGLHLYYRWSLSDSSNIVSSLGISRDFISDKAEGMKAVNDGSSLILGTTYHYKWSKHLGLVAGLQYDYMRFDRVRNLDHRYYFEIIPRL